MTETPLEPAQLINRMATDARAAYQALGRATGVQKTHALMKAAEAMRQQKDAILAANRMDHEAAQAAGLTVAALDRLLLTEARIEAMAKGVETVAALPDPTGKVLEEISRPNGLQISRVSVPLGVIGIIYESRPNVTADAGAIALKAGNAVILRGGSDSVHSSRAIVQCLHAGLRTAGLPESAIQLVPTADRAAVGAMLTANGLIDVIIPRGGKSLTSRVQQESSVPTLLHLDGNCHTYIHASADPQKARDILLNAKMRRTGVCGATESLLIDRLVAPAMLPELAEALTAAGCALRGDTAAQALDARIAAATEEDWGTEYLDAVLSIKLVDGVDEAAAHINRYGSHHTEAVIAEDRDIADRFLQEVDSAIVMVNASTQFADGGEFGMGAEIGISTGRLHARGPVGAAQLTTYKYLVRGNGQVRPV